MKIERVIKSTEARAAGGLMGIVQSMLAQLSPIPEAGVRVTVETMSDLEHIERPLVRMDLAQGRVYGYTCVCGYETADVIELVKHLEAHGARHLVVEPEHRVPREKT